MILFFLSIFVSLSFGYCGESRYCVDQSGLLFCLRAQDMVNNSITRTNDTMKFLALNCSKHIAVDDYAWQSKLSSNVYYSTKNRANCLKALQMYNNLTQKHGIENPLPIECEEIENSATKFGFSLTAILLLALLK